MVLLLYCPCVTAGIVLIGYSIWGEICILTSSSSDSDAELSVSETSAVAEAGAEGGMGAMSGSSWALGSGGEGEVIAGGVCTGTGTMVGAVMWARAA